VSSSYSIKVGYFWMLGDRIYQPWNSIIRNRTMLPRHTFTAWLFFQQRAPAKQRLAKFTNQTGELLCGLCNEEGEMPEHLFLSCCWAKELWYLLSSRWPIPHFNPKYDSFFRVLKRTKGTQKQKHITYAIVAAALYQIWRVQNAKVFDHKSLLAPTFSNHTMEQVA